MTALNGYNREDAGVRAVLALVPQAYLGWCHHFQEDAEISAKRSGADAKKARLLAQGDVLERHRLSGLPAIVHRLWEMCTMLEPRSLTIVEDIIESFIRAQASSSSVGRASIRPSCKASSNKQQYLLVSNFEPPEPIDISSSPERTLIISSKSLSSST